MFTKFYEGWTFRVKIGGVFRVEIGGIKQTCNSVKPLKPLAITKDEIKHFMEKYLWGLL